MPRSIKRWKPAKSTSKKIFGTIEAASFSDLKEFKNIQPTGKKNTRTKTQVKVVIREAFVFFISGFLRP